MSKPNTELERIASKYLKVETLETRHSNDLDFHKLGVNSLQDALAAAYEAGREAGTRGHHYFFVNCPKR